MEPMVDLCEFAPSPELSAALLTGLIVNMLLPNTSQMRTEVNIFRHVENSLASIKAAHGFNLCVFKIGISSDPAERAIHYFENGFKRYYLIHISESASVIEHLEERLIAMSKDVLGCRNERPGGEGRMRSRPPPYFLYIAAACAAQREPIGS